MSSRLLQPPPATYPQRGYCGLLREYPQGANRPKILRVITRLNIGGPAIHTLLLTRELAALQYRTLLVAGVCEPADGDMSYLVRAGDAVRWVPELSRSVRPWSNLKALWRLWRLMRDERPLIVHTHTAMAGCLGRLAAVLSGAPIIIHTFHGNSLSQYFPRRTAGAFRLIEQLLAHFTDVICVLSPQQAGELSGCFRIAPLEKFRIVPLGLELDDCFALPAAAEDGPLTVGWFGRLVPVKNVPLLAETITETVRNGCDIRFLIAGDGPDRAILQRLVRAYGGRVEWLGWQQEILPVLARCHVLLQTSRNEGTPVALIQGMAAARPFLSTAVGGVPDMLSSPVRRSADGVRWYANAALADSTPAALAGGLAALARDRRLANHMGLDARAFAASRYRKERLVSNLDSLYRELIHQKLKESSCMS
jgi:glycosyltransferase involved in cell wall biosynthesis